MADLSFFDNTNDPKKIAQQNRQYGLYQGQSLQDQEGARATDAGGAAQQTDAQLQGLLDPSGTKSKLDQWMNPLASGQGGYNADELSQIRMTPQQQNDIVTGAGISAGLSNAASTAPRLERQRQPAAIRWRSRPIGHVRLNSKGQPQVTP
jgi:hypothetical protein